MEKDTEIELVKMRLDQHDRLHKEFQDSIKGLADGVKRLVEAEIRREQDGEAFKRIFDEIGKLQNEFNNYKEAQTQKELDRYQGFIYRAVGYAALILASLIAGRFGAHLL